ncbi:MAG: StbB family protein [Chitinophagaceae bacterium]
MNILCSWLKIMKVAVINFSGNVGKSTISAHLLHPYMGDCPIFSIESLNNDSSTDGIEVEKILGKKFANLQKQLLLLDTAIVDVGASNVDDFLKMMAKYHGSHEDFDYFLIPVVKEKKQQADTINTIRSLSALGIKAKKIRLIFNKLDIDDIVEEEFNAIFSLHHIEKNFTLIPQAVIYYNEIFEKVKIIGKSISAILADNVNYRQKLRDTQEQKEKEHCVRMIAIKRLAISAQNNLNNVFALIFKGYKHGA